MERVQDGTGNGASCSSAFHFLSGGVAGTSGLVPIPNETRGDSKFSLGGVSIVGAIGDGGCSWEM